jgi:hypothetical protein
MCACFKEVERICVDTSSILGTPWCIGAC